MPSSLARIRGLVLDGQATGASPAHGELLELGWAAIGAAVDLREVRTRLVRPLASPQIPGRIQRLTGIRPPDLRRAVHPRDAWRELVAAAREIASEPRGPCPVVVHFARFEEAFLRSLHEASAPQRPFPLETICTLEIARRLLPALPRRGLRAVAGYFGHDVPALKRARDHVTATALVWQELARLLEEREGVGDLACLREWLSLRPRPGTARGGREYPMAPELRRDVPDRPGVYRMRRGGGDLLYVGKARSLRRRVSSYFRPRALHHERTLEMLAQARRLDFTVTATALEAALLEADEIKRLAPRYNVALRTSGRQLAFWSADLRRHAPRRDRRHPLGPFPSPESLARLAALRLWLCEDDDRHGAAALGIPPRYAPAAPLLAAGLGLFRARHRLVGPAATPALLRLGVRLQRRSARSEAMEPDASDGAASPAAEAPRSWSAERVADACEETAAQGARLVRRSRWLCRLAESSLAWSEDERRWLLVVSGGRPIRHSSLPAGAPVPLPPGHARPTAQRQRGLDLRAYDQLSVLTRELKALVSAGAPLTLKLGPGPALGREALAARLSRV